MFTHEIINSKDVFIVQDHHHALLPWSSIRAKMDTAPILISLDHHTDNKSAFLNHIYHTYGADNVTNENIRHELASKIDYFSPDSVISSIKKLRHDEHIHAATLSDILNIAFVIQLMDSTGTEPEEYKKYMSHRFGNMCPWNVNVELPKPPFSYVVPDNRIFIIPTLPLPGYEHMIHDENCNKILCNSVIEDFFLKDKIQKGNEMAAFVGITDIEQQGYILDIDLDYFHPRKAVEPNFTTIFSRLVRNALAITIALESTCVSELALDGEVINSIYLLKKVKSLIANA